MAIQKVDTEAIALAASAIATAGANVTTEFQNVRNAGNTMISNWNSKAGTAAQTLMYELFAGSEAQASVLQNYANVLQQVVNPGYVESETANTTLADQFL